MALNKAMLIGNLGKDPEVRHLESGVPVVTIPLATTERYKDRNGEVKEQTEWHNVVLWRSWAEFAEKYLRKGMQIYVEGKIRSRSWEDQSGQKRYITEIVADVVRMLGRKSDNEHQGAAAAKPAVVSAPTPPPAEEVLVEQQEGDDLPF
ncbi:MAG: single-stranded DNA-binding protein [Bacteroidales bacterium]|nr:single-stranded DNA-binding protein [Bacteroidales bacterium]MCL2132784.1 single-stranded DNA-binding protein [Bacteroidales bacterium]